MIDAEIVSVSTPEGTFRGIRRGGADCFLGIPFGTAERWKPPRDPAPLPGGVFDAFQFGPSPWQDTARDLADTPAGMSEDCLNLNLYTSDVHMKNKAVMVWVYGGAQISGNNIGTVDGPDGRRGLSYDPSVMLKEYPDVMVVIPNYRVGIWGSMDLSGLEKKDPEYRFSRNLSRLDILQCLRWVKRNIASFGGDPDNVTLFGQSAGSSNITALMLMEESAGMFRKAICQSSFSLDISLTSLKDCRRISGAFLDILGCSEAEALCRTPEELLEAQKKLSAASMGGSPVFEDIESKLFSPVVDDLLIPENYWELFTAGKCGNVRLMCGTNEGEYDLQFDALCGGDCDKARGLVVSHCRGKFDPVKGCAPWIPDEYVRERNRSSLYSAYEDLKADVYLRMGAVAYALVRQQFEETYCCFLALPTSGSARFFHGAEIPALFSGKTDISQENCRLIREMWCSFALYGKPRVHGSDHVWRPFGRDTRETLIVSDEVKTVNGVRPRDTGLLLPLLREYSGCPGFRSLCGAESASES